MIAGRFALLLWPRWRGLANARRSREGRTGAVRLVLFALFGLGFMAAAFYGSRWLFLRFLEVEFLAELLIQRVLGIVLLFFSGLLVFSNVITAFSNYYLADDLPLLVSSPVPVGRLYLARLVDNWAQSSWMMLVFALPILAGCGPVLGAPWTFYAALPLATLPLTVLCAATGTMITLALARWLPARRTHDVLLVLAVVGFLVVYIAFRLAEPEQFLKPDGFEDFVALIGGLKAAGNPWSPVDWTLTTVFSLARGEPGEAVRPLLTLYTGAPAACAVGAWLARGVYLGSYSLAQEGRGGGERSLLARLLDRVRRRAPARYPRSVTAAFVRRDTLMFFRTTGQWTQLLLIGALVVVYVFNFKHFRTLQDTGLVGPLALCFVNLALSGLVTTTIAVRFLYPAVSLEGRAFWAVRAAPITPRQLLAAKVRWGLWPLLLLSLVLTVASNAVVQLPPALSLAAAFTAALTTVGLTGMGVGLGATAPRFTLDNPARIASGVGGVLYMLLGLGYMVVVAGLLGRPIAALHHFAETGYVPRPARLALFSALVAAALAVTWLAHALPLRLGARALGRLDEDAP